MVSAFRAQKRGVCFDQAYATKKLVPRIFLALQPMFPKAASASVHTRGVFCLFAGKPLDWSSSTEVVSTQLFYAWKRAPNKFDVMVSYSKKNAF
jgi:hypothetical protein